MTPDQFSQLCKPREESVIDPAQWGQTPRTLLYGYTCKRDTFHVYVDATGVHAVIFEVGAVLSFRSTCQQGGLPLSACVPDKRVYVEPSDFEFCKYLQDNGLKFSFTTGWRATPELLPFAGKTLGMIEAAQESA